VRVEICCKKGRRQKGKKAKRQKGKKAKRQKGKKAKRQKGKKAENFGRRKIIINLNSREPFHVSRFTFDVSRLPIADCRFTIHHSPLTTH
jgi:hypothetical protein